MQRLDVHVVLGGGIFRNDDRAFFDRVTEGIQAVAPLARIEVLRSPPVLGAALMALDRIGASRSAYTRTRAALTHERLDAHAHTGREGGT
jgi:hypothetical protein